MREITRRKYIDAINEIHLALNYNERANLQDICKAHNVTKGIPTILKKNDIIRVTILGHKWIDTAKTKSEIADIIYLSTSEMHHKLKMKRLEKRKDEILSNINQDDLNAWKSKVNDQKTESSNTLIKNQIDDVIKMVENIDHERTFELKIFGITILKIRR